MRRILSLVPVLGALLMLAPASPVRAACQTCGPGLYCMETQAGGARACLAWSGMCLLSGPCYAGGGRNLDGFGAETALAFTLLDDGAPVGTAPRAIPGLGRDAVGRGAARLLRDRMRMAVDENGLVWSALLFGEGHDIAVRDGRREGFSLRLERGRGMARAVVRALEGGRPGRVLASEPLRGDDALVVRVTLDGRPRLLVVQPQELRAGERDARITALLAGMGEPAAPGTPPPFDIEGFEP
jgi:hypothetical protein